MKPSELKYITQEIIDKGGINVASPEMSDEARRYNMDAVTNNAVKRRTDVITGIWYVLSLPFAALQVCMMLMGRTLQDWGFYGAGEFQNIMTYAMIGAVLLGIIAYIGLMSYYVVFRFQRDPKLVLLCSLPLLLALFSRGGLFIVAINMIMAFWYTKTDEKLSTEAGYPAFVRLAVTTMNSDEDNIQNVTYDGIRERTKHLRADDEEFL